eukprot:TRINITY_DN32530_c0_g1_i1.p1 TRINITY_DN32530_c0_g1~~TRINITY_DN32530_c0_g1_i1.p1  ORF type:complete len:225 (+),score=15.24 TRINITY_DN32530_c0_g1_i1:178-852(+)
MKGLVLRMRSLSMNSSVSSCDLAVQRDISQASTSIDLGDLDTAQPFAQDSTDEESSHGSFELPQSYPSGLVVRNTFIDVEDPQARRAANTRRSRSAEPRGSGSWVECDSTIANIGVRGGRPDVAVPATPEVLRPAGRVDGAERVPLAAGQLSGRLVVQESEEILSVGSALHRFERCVPCGYFWTPRGCQSGASCMFCHLCGAGEKRRRRNRHQKLALRPPASTC